MAALRRTSSRYHYSVYINCPFDPRYHRLLRASAFGILACGFAPRCALESAETGKARLEKIVAIIKECRFGLHDLSRVEVGDDELPRFNMAFECGLFWGCMRYGDAADRTKSLKVIDAKPHRYHEYLSDISGGDIGVHGNRIASIFEQIRAWLAPMVDEQIRVPGGDWITQSYARFNVELPVLLAEMRKSGATTLTPKDLEKQQYFVEYVRIAGNWLAGQPGYVAEPQRQARSARRRPTRGRRN